MRHRLGNHMFRRLADILRNGVVALFRNRHPSDKYGSQRFVETSVSVCLTSKTTACRRFERCLSPESGAFEAKIVGSKGGNSMLVADYVGNVEIECFFHHFYYTLVQFSNLRFLNWWRVLFFMVEL